MWKIRLCELVFWIVFVAGLFYLDAHLDRLLGIHRSYAAYPAGMQWPVTRNVGRH